MRPATGALGTIALAVLLARAGVAQPAPMPEPSGAPPRASAAPPSSPASAPPSSPPAASGLQGAPLVPVVESASPVPAPTFSHAVVRPQPGGDPWSDAERAALRADLDVLLRDPAFAGAHVGAFVATTAGDALYAHGADDAFQPASTLKLVVGSAALERLGPAFRFRTRLEEAGATGGSIASLVLRGGGDPFLGSADLDAAALTVARAGIASVRDDVSFDASHYDATPYPDGWVWDDFAEDYAPPVTALTYDENVAHFAVAPGDAPGSPARVTLDGRPFAAVSEGCTHPGLVVARAVTGVAGSTSTLDATTSRFGCEELVGAVPLDARGPEAIDVAVRLPELAARARLIERLAAHGVTVPQREDAFDDAAFSAHRWTGTTPLTPVWTHLSAPLASWLGPAFWIPSDNLVAELLLQELGAAVRVRGGTRANGLASELRFLREVGVDPASVTLADGSGLSQYDRITPRDLVAVLRHDWNGPYRDAVLDALPVGGARGTIEGIAGTPLAGRVFAKTGSMSHVRGLAGYIATLRHGAAVFAFSVDDWNGDYRELAAARARVLERIAGYATRSVASASNAASADATTWSML